MIAPVSPVSFTRQNSMRMTISLKAANRSSHSPVTLSPPSALRQSSCPSHLTLQLPRSSFTLNNNKSRYASDKIIQIAADFWNTKISALSLEEQTEIGVTMYLDMLVKDKSMKAIFQQNFNESLKIRSLALKFLNMMGWLIRTLSCKDEHMEETLKKLGVIHQMMGVKNEHFTVMVESLHDTFAHYFPHDYRIKEHYAVDYIFMLASKLMMGESMSSHCIQSDYLETLGQCLKSDAGRKYLFKFLQQTLCDELVIYLESIHKFEQQTCNKGRFMIARNIVDASINAHSALAINISYEARMSVTFLMHEYEQQFRAKQDLKISASMFDDVNKEVYRLIYQNHWRTFKDRMKKMNQSTAAPLATDGN